MEMAMASFIPLRQRKSKWTFDTSSSFGASASYVSGEVGHIYLDDPSGTNVVFAYAMLGWGVSASIKMPFTLTGAPASFANTGTVYVTQSFGDGELTRDDLTGMFIAREISMGGVPFFGGSATIMLAGIDSIVSKVDTALRYFYPMANTWRDIYDVIFGDDPVDQYLGIGANAVIVMAGVNATMTLGISGVQYVGWLR
jgi:hypothetical protein